MNSNSISQQSPSYAKIYAPKNEQLAVWNEGGDEDQSTHDVSQSVQSGRRRTIETNQSTHVSQSVQSERSRMMESTLASRRSSQSSESSYYSDEEGEDNATLRSQGVTAIEKGVELASAVGRALAIREESQYKG